jgi:negative regulator of sigma E activity
MTDRTDMTDTQTDKLYDHHRQQLSAMLDGELPPDQAKFMLRRLEHDRELATCWERWQVCGDILRGRHDALLPADFSHRVASAIAGGEQVAGSTESTAAVATKSPRWARWGGGAALAASVAMAALFVGRQAPEIDQESTTAPVQVVAGTTSAPAVPAPTIPATPAPAPDAATTLAAAVAVAEVPRRAVERRSSRSQSQRAAARTRQQAAAPVAVAVNAPIVAMPDDARTTLADASPAATLASDPFAAQPAPTRPWPRAILPNFPADGAFTASYGNVAGNVAEHPFHPFEPRVELQQQPAAAGDRSGSGPR